MEDSERDNCVTVLADALVDDPGWSLVCPDAPTRHKLLTTLCNEAITMAHACNGETWVACLRGRIAGCFIWNAPGKASIPASTYFGGLARAFPLVIAHPLVVTRCVRTLIALDSIKPKEDVFYGVFLGCAVQGQGVGSQLVKQLIRRCGNTALYLETQNPRNLPFYERLGFKTHGIIEQTYPGGPRNFGLLHGQLQAGKQLASSPQAPASVKSLR